MTRIAQISLFLLVAGCQTRGTGSNDTEALLNTDRAWAQVAAAGKNADSVVAFWSDDARVAMAGAPVVQGKAALKEMVTSSMAAPGFHIAWTPENAVIAASGDLGYTTGTNEMSVPDSSGKITKMTGRYLTVWRKDRDGRWRCVEDYSSPAPAAAKPNS
jgi:ketosteroid isomerase-like protein